MSRSSLFWLDAQDCLALLQRAGVVDRSGTAVPRAGVPRQAAPQPATPQPAAPRLAVPRLAIPQPAAPAPSPAIEAAPAVPATGDPELPTFQPQDPLEKRLLALLGWVQSYGIERAFVADRDGLVLVEHQPDPSLAAAGATLTGDWCTVRDMLELQHETALTVHLQTGQHLHLFTTLTPWGRMSLGLLAQPALAWQDLQRIRELFRLSLTVPDAEPTHDQ